VIYSHATKWEMCLATAAAIIKLDPARCDARIHRSFALHELKRTQEVFDQLLTFAERFPKVWLLGHLSEANAGVCLCCVCGRQSPIMKRSEMTPSPATDFSSRVAFGVAHEVQRDVPRERGFLGRGSCARKDSPAPSFAQRLVCFGCRAVGTCWLASG